MLPADCPTPALRAGACVIPRPGESMTAAIFRNYDRTHGTGLTATDQTAVIVTDHAATQQALTDALKLNAELLTEREQGRKALTKANELIADLQNQLEEARANAVSDATRSEALTAAEVAWVLHVEGHR